MRLVWIAVMCASISGATPSLAQARIDGAPVPSVPSDSNIVYGNVGNAALLMDVFRPSQPNGLGIIFISGSGWGGVSSYPHNYDDIPLKDDARNRGYEGRLVQGLVERGYTVFSVNHRFAPESPFPRPFYDAQRAVRFVRASAARYRIDPRKLGAIGHSSGAHLAAMLGVKDTVIDNPKGLPYQQGSSQVQAVVTLAAPFLITLANLARPGNLRIVTNLVGPLPAPNTDGAIPVTGVVAAASPITYVTAQAAPMLIYQAENDSTILKTAASVMAARLAQAAVPYEVRMLPTGGHAPAYDIDEIDAWFRRFLK